MRLRLVFLAIIFALSGCLSLGPKETRGSRWLPWNWFHPDSSGKVEHALGKVDEADTALRDNAHKNAHATKLAIEAEKQRQLAAFGAASRELQTADDYAGRTVRALDASEGFLSFDVQAELAEMVRLRNSQVESERKRGEALLDTVDAQATKAAMMKITYEGKLADARRKVGEEQQRALVAEEKWSRLWFYVWAILIGSALLWLAMQVLTRLAATNPALAPFAMAFNKVAAPALHAEWEKVRDIGSRIGGAIADARKKAPAIAEQLAGFIDARLDQHHQELAANAAAAEGAPPPAT